MRKIGTKLFLSLVLSALMLSISTSVFATEGVNETETVSSNNARELGFFNSLKKVDNISDYACITEDLKKNSDNSIMIKSGYNYLIVYENTEGDISVEVTEQPNLTLGSISDIADSMFQTSPSSADYNETNIKFNLGTAHVLVKDGKDTIYVGSFSSKNDIPVKDLSYNVLPKVTLSIKSPTSDSAVIHAEYSLDDKFKSNVPNQAVIVSVELWTGDDCKERISVDSDSTSTDFTVSSNGKYKVKAITYISECMSDEIEVSGIKTSTPEEDAEKNADTTAPKVTFSVFPDSALNNTSTELTMYSDEPAILNFNGVSSNDYVTEMKFSVSENGEYNYQAQDKSGNTTSTTLKVEFFKDNTLDDFDRDSFWDDPITSGLPQTGSIGFYTLIVLGLALVVGGAFFVYKGRKKKLNTIENNETSEEQSDDTESKTEDSTDELSEQRQVLTETLKKVQEDKE